MERHSQEEAARQTDRLRGDVRQGVGSNVSRTPRASFEEVNAFSDALLLECSCCLRCQCARWQTQAAADVSNTLRPLAALRLNAALGSDSPARCRRARCRGASAAALSRPPRPSQPAQKGDQPVAASSQWLTPLFSAASPKKSSFVRNALTLVALASVAVRATTRPASRPHAPLRADVRRQRLAA